MAFAVFPLTMAPDWGLEDTVDANIEEQALGDGYVVRRPKGINYLRSSWSPSWSLLTKDQAEDTYAWLKARLKLTPFYWTHPTDGNQYKVICTSVSKVISDVGIYQLKAEFTQDFNLS